MKYLIHHLKKEIKNNTFDYLLLITAGIFFLIAINAFRGERSFEFIIILGFAGFYIIWGVYHHIIDDSLHLKNVVEYILIGFIILFLLKIILIP